MRTYEARAVGLLVCGFAVAYTIFGLFRHWHFASSAFDLGIFDQAVWHLSRFRAPARSISGFSNILGDHFYPIIVCFAPLYWLRSGPETLIVAQSVLLAGSIVPVYLHLRTNVAKGDRANTLCVVWPFLGTPASDVFRRTRRRVCAVTDRDNPSCLAAAQVDTFLGL